MLQQPPRQSCHSLTAGTQLWSSWSAHSRLPGPSSCLSLRSATDRHVVGATDAPKMPFALIDVRGSPGHGDPGEHSSAGSSLRQRLLPMPAYARRASRSACLASRSVGNTAFGHLDIPDSRWAVPSAWRPPNRRRPHEREVLATLPPGCWLPSCYSRERPTRMSQSRSNNGPLRHWNTHTRQPPPTLAERSH